MPTLNSLVLTILLVAPVRSEEPAYTTSRATAKDNFLAERFDKAAHAFEALWTDYQRLPDLYAAGLARYRLEHHAHAIEHWELFLELAAASSFDDPKVGRARTQLEDARKRVIPTPLTLELHARHPPSSAELVLQHEDTSRPALVRSAEVRAGKTLITVALDMGSWTITASVNGQTKIQQVRVPAEPGSARFVFEQRVALPRPVRKKLTLGLSLGGAALIGAGGGSSLIVHHTSFRNAINIAPEKCGPYDLFDCTKDVQDSLLYREIGSQAMGFGAGLLVTGLTTLTPRARNRRTAWLAEAATGGVLAGVGAWLYVSSWMKSIGVDELQCENGKDPCKPSEDSESEAWDPNYVSELRAPSIPRLAGAIMLGTGVGLFTGATIGMLVQRPFLRRQTRERISRVSILPQVSTQNTGLVVSGAF